MGAVGHGHSFLASGSQDTYVGPTPPKPPACWSRRQSVSWKMPLHRQSPGQTLAWKGLGGVCWMRQAPQASACDLPDSRHRRPGLGGWSLEAGSPALSTSPRTWLLGGWGPCSLGPFSRLMLRHSRHPSWRRPGGLPGICHGGPSPMHPAGTPAAHHHQCGGPRGAMTGGTSSSTSWTTTTSRLRATLGPAGR